MAQSYARYIVRLAANASGLVPAIGGRIVSAGGVLALSISATRYLDATQSGRFFTAFTALMGLAIFMRMGLDILVLRLASQTPKQRSVQYLFDALKLVLAACALLIIVAFVWGLFFPIELTYIYIAVSLFPLAASNIVAAFLKANGMNFSGSAAEVGLISLITAAILPLILPSGAEEALAALMVTSWFIFVFIILMCLKAYGKPNLNTSPRFDLVFEGRNIWAVSILSYASQWASLVFASFLLPVENVTTVNMLFRLLAPLQFVILAVDYWLAPRYSSCYVERIPTLRARAILMSYALCAPYALTVLLFPAEVISLLFGEEFVGASGLLRILIVATLIQIAFGANGILLNMLEQDRVVFLSVVLRSFSTLVILFFLYWCANLMIVVISFALPLFAQALFLRKASDKFLSRKGQS
jgi:O-antigen/teichoic acid export membrane protein|tara:strand:- start:123 stop:1364 length:1242 start_codon:yes stop_codon:yes gene_type:complete